MVDEDRIQIRFTEREMEILRCLIVGMPDLEIAGRLLLSVNTIKWYDRRIYAKLSVKNRTQAVARIHHLHLLDERMPMDHLDEMSVAGQEEETDYT